MTRIVPVSFVIKQSEMSRSLDSAEISNFRDEGERFWDALTHHMNGFARTHCDPHEVGADKTDFVLTFADGHVYEGRLDIKHPDRGSAIECDLDVSAHIVRHLEIQAGLRCPSTMSHERYRDYLRSVLGADYQERAQDMLADYALTSDQLRFRVAREPDLDLRRRRAVDAVHALDRPVNACLDMASDELVERVATALNESRLDYVAMEEMAGYETDGIPDLSTRERATSFLQKHFPETRIRNTFIAFAHTEELERIAKHPGNENNPDQMLGMST